MQGIILENLCELKKAKALLAFSHGIDSTALFHLLRQNNINFACALINYKTRPQSLNEYISARALCKMYGVEFFSKEAVISGGNFESKARKIRYDFFYDLCIEQGFDTLILAHQLNDLFEWFLLRLSKGAGLANALGFSSYSKYEIKPKCDIFIARPLIYTSRIEILEYLHSHYYEYFIDSSNFNQKYSRNFFRHNYSDSFVRLFASGLKASFKALERDKKVLLGEFVYEKSPFFILKRSPSEIDLIDKACKRLGVVLSALSRAEVLKQNALVISHKIAIAKNEKFIFVAPFSKTQMPKNFKEKCRILKIPPLIRPYLYDNTELLAEISTFIH